MPINWTCNGWLNLNNFFLICCFRYGQERIKIDINGTLTIVAGDLLQQVGHRQILCIPSMLDYLLVKIIQYFISKWKTLHTIIWSFSKITKWISEDLKMESPLLLQNVCLRGFLANIDTHPFSWGKFDVDIRYWLHDYINDISIKTNSFQILSSIIYWTPIKVKWQRSRLFFLR